VNREDIIREADAWLKMNGLASDGQTCFLMALFAQHISALAAAQEREACAKVCEDMGEFYLPPHRSGRRVRRCVRTWVSFTMPLQAPSDHAGR